MPLSQEQQLDAILTTYGPIIGMILVLLGVSLTLAGPRLLPLLTAWALFCLLYTSPSPRDRG